MGYCQQRFADRQRYVSYVRNLTGIRSNFGEPDALFSTPAGTSSAEGGCSDRGQFLDSGRGARSTDSRFARPARLVQFRGPFVEAAHCHMRNFRTSREHLRLGQVSTETLKWRRRSAKDRDLHLSAP